MSRIHHFEDECELARLRVALAQHVEEGACPWIAVAIQRMSEAVDRLATAQARRDRRARMLRTLAPLQHRFNARADAAMSRAFEGREPRDHDRIGMRPGGRDAAGGERRHVEFVIGAQNERAADDV